MMGPGPSKHWLYTLILKQTEILVWRSSHIRALSSQQTDILVGSDSSVKQCLLWSGITAHVSGVSTDIDILLQPWHHHQYRVNCFVLWYVYSYDSDSSATSSAFAFPLISGPARPLLMGWQVPHTASPGPAAPLMYYSLRGSSLHTGAYIRGFWGAGCGSVYVCVRAHRKACSLHPSPPTTTITISVSTNWMLNKPVCWIIEDFGPEKALISIQALWTQSVQWQDGLSRDIVVQQMFSFQFLGSIS